MKIGDEYMPGVGFRGMETLESRLNYCRKMLYIHGGLVPSENGQVKRRLRLKFAAPPDPTSDSENEGGDA